MFRLCQYSGYVIGVFDMAESVLGVPDGVTQQQVLAIVAKYLKRNPEQWNQRAAIVVLRALKTAFPRKKE